jgi:hypothetical protein
MAMRRAPALLRVSLLLLLTTSVGVAAARHNAKDNPRAAAPSQAGAQTGSPTLKVNLRLQDDSPFIGVASLRVTSREGHEAAGAPSGSDGETIFNAILPGNYTVEANAPGFLTVRQETKIEPGNRVQTLFLILKPGPLPATAAEPTTPGAPLGSAYPTSWIPPGVDDAVPSVEKGIACPLTQVTAGVGRRMKELVDNLQKFDATEHVEHYPVNDAGARGKPEVRTFDYVVTVKLSEGRVADLEEYRNGTLDAKQFPAKVATTGLPTMALAFHPAIVSEFDLVCEGLGQWDGHPAWQVHFAQRPDRPNRLRFYTYKNVSHPMPLKGRVWIDAATFQIRHFESELMEPVPEVELTREQISIDYGPVQFHTQKQQLWLPLVAELYWEQGGRRVYRRHTYSDFKIFEVESAQQIQMPEGSYCFTNTSDHDIAGILIVSPASGDAIGAVSIRFTVPAGENACKQVGPGKDVSMPVDSIGSATFMHNGATGSIKADINLTKASALDLVPETDVGAIKP